ncbi:MAG: DUF6265 family protein [Brevundimonas sp.]|uniref:DUF6265 family protein n=1 Tax=Brevundimonas sp. TaxID=1871086 RepID=UPI002732A729|nr:DUF6265 family protein [Brevundimonas sp.]MDP3377667.1 DUF6265 family protein [Brevundimonas sp.]
MSLLPALAAALLTTATPAQDPVAGLGWMSGYWLDCSDGREASETWSDARGGLMVGHAISLSASGRPGFELAFIAPTAEGPAYVVMPSGQAQTAFVMTEQGEDFVVFSNPDNDFPTHIRYESDGDGLKARIDGEIAGTPRSVEWRFDRRDLNTRCPAA